MDRLPALTIGSLAETDPLAVETLLDLAFGADRRQRTAYRLRAGAEAIDTLSFAARDGERGLLGSIQCWPVAHHGDDGVVTPLVLVGPVAVFPAAQRGGIGGRLMTAMLEAAGEAAMMLIGDPEYYGRYGFSAERTGGWRLPGPFEPRRLLARGWVPASGGEVVPATALPLPAARAV
jgi:predicted N-acetyltransferase YhbS